MRHVPLGDVQESRFAGILELVHSQEMATLGVVDTTAESMRATLADPMVDAGSSTAMVDGEQVTGLRLVTVNPDEKDIAVDVWVAAWLPAEKQTHLVAELTSGMADMATALADRVDPERHVAPAAVAYEASMQVWQLAAGSYRVDPLWRAALQQLGLRPIRTFERLRLDHGPDVAEPTAPAGVVARPAVGIADLQIVHRLHLESFADHWGGEAQRTFDDWLTWQRSDGGYREDLWTIAELDGEPVAFSASSDVRVDFGCSFVTYLGVLRQARGRGIATYLLRREFALSAARGFAATEIAVDSASQTGADRLYRSVGMVPYRTVDLWLAPIGVTGQASADTAG